MSNEEFLFSIVELSKEFWGGTVGKAMSKHGTFYDGVELAYLHPAQYTDGTPALIAELVWDDGTEEVNTLSVNLSDYSMIPAEGHVYIPDYGEKEGIAKALVEAGAGVIIQQINIGYGQGYEFELAPWVLRQESFPPNTQSHQENS